MKKLDGGGEEGEEEEGGEEEEEVQETGFGGIKLSSVEDIIAKARTAEAFLSVPTAGLSDNLSDLAKLVDETEENREHSYVRYIVFIDMLCSVSSSL